MIEDKPWFVAKDALLCLGCSLENGGAAPYLQHLNMGEDEKRHVLKSTIGPFYGWPNGGLLCISESGLYKLIMRSDNPAAKRFQDWVTREVLPALRKDGMYIMGEEKVKTGEMSHHLPRKPAGYEVIFTRH